MKQTILVLLMTPLLMLGQCLSGDCDNGAGEYKFKNGVYQGEFIGSELSGTGLFLNKKGYTYSGDWLYGLKEGFGSESFKKGFSYKGEFLNNQRHGYGEASFSDSKFMKNIEYKGDWLYGSVCGKGELIYSREVKYGRKKIVERNILKGEFLNGVYQGRMTTPYSDELVWEPFNLKMEHFQNFQTITEKEYKRLKNPATIEGDIFFTCECLSGFLVFDAGAIFRKELSWWAINIPTKTKTTILNTRQGEFDIIEWHARKLKNELNKERLPCNNESVSVAWSLLELTKKECRNIRRLYTTETAWNPKKGSQKNNRVQEKWNNKIAKKLKKYEKLNQKTLEKFRKKISKNISENCLPHPLDLTLSPIESPSKNTESLISESVENERQKNQNKETEKKEIKKQKEKDNKEAEKLKKEIKKQKEKDNKAEKKRQKEEKKQKALKKLEEKELRKLARKSKKEANKLRRAQRSFVPQFPRSKQLE